jgi:hypothetical protein
MANGDGAELVPDTQERPPHRSGAGARLILLSSLWDSRQENAIVL